MASNSILAKMAVQISANTAEFNKKLAETNKGFNNFTGNLTKIAGTLGVAFGVREVANFAFEVSKLAGEAEGVSAAFERLPNNVRLMNDLKEATGGTVSELELMKRAVQASNFDIELSALPKLLQFATLRAQQTGQSVDYLVDSIVTGIGRKSKLILDNLGISAVALGEKLNGVSTDAASVGQVAKAVGEIAEESLSKMAGFSDNAATRAQKLAAEWENFKVQLGGAGNEFGILSEGIDAATKALQNLTVFLKSDASDALTDYLRLALIIPRKTIDAANAALEYANSLQTLEHKVKEFNEEFSNRPFVGVLEDTKRFNEAVQELGKVAEREGKKVILLRDEVDRVVAVIKPFADATTVVTKEEEKQIDTLEVLKEQLKALNAQFEETDITDKKRLKNIANEIISLQEQIRVIENLKKARREVPDFDISFNLPEFDSEAVKNAFDNSIGGISIPIEFDLDTESTEELDKEVDAILERWSTTAGLVSQSLNGIADAFGAAVAGEQSFASSLASLTLDIIDSYLKQALAAAIAKSMTTGSAFGGPVVGLALAAASVAAVKGLFRKAVGTSGGGGVGGGLGDRRPSASGSAQDSQMTVVLKGEVKGTDLKLAIERVDRNNRYSRN